MASLPKELYKKYRVLRPEIRKRLEEFSKISGEDLFYEMCFCICTPQSKAKNALEVEKKLRNKNFRYKKYDPVKILENKDHYIRFHNQKAKRLLMIREQFNDIEKILSSGLTAFEKRKWLVENVNGFGMKEASHFLRNTGCRNLSILDRHILKHLVKCGLFKEIPKVGSINQYLEIEKTFCRFAQKINIDMDELDLLFWSYETGEILK